MSKPTMEVISKATGEKILIKADRFNPEIHKEINDVVEEKVVVEEKIVEQAEEAIEEKTPKTKEELQAALDSKGIPYDKRLGIAKLKELLNN